MKLLSVVAALLLAGPRQEEPGKQVDFVRDMQPLFTKHCLKCHGPEKPKGQFRLDAKGFALKGGVTGKAIIPGKGGESRLVQLLLHKDADERMPRKAPALAPAEIDLVRRWIDQGAGWPDSATAADEQKKHWAYVKPLHPAVPVVNTGGWVRTPIDAFVLARLEKEGFAPAPEAAKETLLRRVSLDLTGLPPSLKELDEFLADGSSDGYEKVVDRLLASPHYGERWARPWLDLARYADTNGFNFDSRRTMWKYRDWVIDALNRDLPFTDFTIEQIAGDMLPDATLGQKVATGFHRNTMTNEEGGVDKDEARWETQLDRVHTTATVWLGSTFACAQCHNHKYDPFTQKDFYRFLAFWEDCEEPRIELLTPEEERQRKELRADLAREEALLKKAELPAHVAKALNTPLEKRSNTNRNDLITYYRAQAPAALQPVAAKCLEINRDLEKLDVATALVFREKRSPGIPSAPIRIKGGYATPGERVPAGVPASLHPLPEGARPDRLTLARWLVSEENPLVARVAVNRYWMEFFGHPLLDTPEDFGAQSRRPEHPELMDWLATEFVRGGWKPKAIHRLIATSAAYRQSSRVTPALLERDPYNKLAARGPRFRMEAEMVRDTMLAASGLLSRKVGGPSVFPLQADASGVIAINKVETAWKASEGEDRHRRGLYTHWRRTAPFSAFAAFDAPSREVCTVRRARTNTPLQALSGMNDPAYFEAAKALAARMLEEAGPGDRERAAHGFRLCTARVPGAWELDRLVAALGRERKAGAAEGKAWTLIANVILNLDETLTKE